MKLILIIFTIFFVPSIVFAEHSSLYLVDFHQNLDQNKSSEHPSTRPNFYLDKKLSGEQVISAFSKQVFAKYPKIKKRVQKIANQTFGWAFYTGDLLFKKNGHLDLKKKDTDVLGESLEDSSDLLGEKESGAFVRLTIGPKASLSTGLGFKLVLDKDFSFLKIALKNELLSHPDFDYVYRGGFVLSCVF